MAKRISIFVDFVWVLRSLKNREKFFTSFLISGARSFEKDDFATISKDSSASQNLWWSFGNTSLKGAVRFSNLWY